MTLLRLALTEAGREQLGEVEDRLFSTVFLGSGLLFVVLTFAASVNATSTLLLRARPGPGSKAGMTPVVTG